MKNTVKVIILIMVVILSIFVLSGCGKKQENVTETNDNTSSIIETEVDSEEKTEALEDTKIKRVFDEILLSGTKPVYLKYKIKLDEGFSELEEALVIYATKDGIIYVDTVTSGNRATILQAKDKSYTINHETKTYVELPREEGMSIDTIINKEIIQNPTVKAGKEKIYNVEYEYEQLHSDGEYNRFYFIKGTDILKYWRLSDGQLLEIEEYGNDVDDSWFSIPEDYTLASTEEVNLEVEE